MMGNKKKHMLLWGLFIQQKYIGHQLCATNHVPGLLLGFEIAQVLALIELIFF